MKKSQIFSIDETVYAPVISRINDLWEWSKYDNTIDLYEIETLLNFIDPKQIECKLHLVENLIPFIPQVFQIWNTDQVIKIIVAGGWYGLLPHLLSQIPFVYKVKNVDEDKGTLNICKMIFPEMNVQHANIFDMDYKGYHIFASTSVEHFFPEQFKKAVREKERHQIWALQSNNWEELDAHINCSESLEHFEDTCGFTEILFSSTKDMGVYERYTLIGR